MTTRAIDPTFLALPLDRLADVALRDRKTARRHLRRLPGRAAPQSHHRRPRSRAADVGRERDRRLQRARGGQRGVGIRRGHRPYDRGGLRRRAARRRSCGSAGAAQHRARYACRRAGVPRHLRLQLRDRSVRRGRRSEDQFPAHAERARARVEADRSRHLARDARPRAEILRLARRIAHHAAARTGEGRSHGRSHRQIHRRVRDDGKCGAAGGEGMGISSPPATTGAGTPTRFRRCSSRRCRRRRLRPAVTTSSSIPPICG